MIRRDWLKQFVAAATALTLIGRVAQALEQEAAPTPSRRLNSGSELFWYLDKIERFTIR